MALFPRSYITNDQSAFPPIFRLLDEFDQYSRSVDRPSHFSSVKSFTPKFDIKELNDSYQLHGELPGIEQKDVEIEFTDASTLTIKGRSERSYSEGTKCESGSCCSSNNEACKDKSDKADKADKADKTDKAEKKDDRPQRSDNKYWVMERSVGEFSRSFGFPVPIDQDAVKASMKNGILSVLVPKAKKQENRRIKIE